jgi:HlyD family secretion protein
MNSQTEDVIDVLGLDGRSRRAPKRWFWIAAVALAALAVIAIFLRTREAAAPTYLTEAARQGPLLVTVTATGTLQPTDQVDIGSEVSGVIDDVFVDFNQMVTQGQIIARLDTQTLEARLASARASLAVAQASRVQAEATVVETRAKAVRSRELAARDIVSQQSLETDEAAAQRAVAQVASAAAQVTAAQASLQEAETALAKAVIRAPIDGMIISREVDPGQTVAATFQTPVLFKLAGDLRQMELHLDLDESDIGQVREGQLAEFRVDAYPGRSFDAVITSVRFNPREVNNVVTYETVLAVENPELLLRPGMTATADIMIDRQDSALLVPNRALRFLPPVTDGADAAPAGPRVWVLRGGAPAAISVATGLSNGEFSEITDGDVAPGTALIVDIEREPRTPSGGGPFG